MRKNLQSPAVHRFAEMRSPSNIKRIAQSLSSSFALRNFHTKRERKLQQMASEGFYFVGTENELYNRFRPLMSMRYRRSIAQRIVKGEVSPQKIVWVIDLSIMDGKLDFCPLC